MLHYGPARGHLRVLKAMRAPKANRILLALESFLRQEEPTVIQWLRSLWEDQQNAITYADIRDAIIEGIIDQAWVDQWQQDYSDLVAEKLRPKWLDAMKEASDAQLEEHDGFAFDVTTPEVLDWIEREGTKLAVNLTNTQHEGMKAVIEQAALGNFGPDELARAIRPMIGLFPRQIRACERYYEALRQDGIKAAEARLRAMNYAANAHRYRAQSIARTELCNAFNAGGDLGVRQAQSQGYLGKVKKRWVTAEDERVCDVCGPLDDVVVGQDEKFPDGPSLPGAHPQCRCVVIYEEVKDTG